jgi:hypothetical protein
MVEKHIDKDDWETARTDITNALHLNKDQIMHIKNTMDDFKQLQKNNVDELVAESIEEKMT